jgi:hypothetical protein
MPAYLQSPARELGGLKLRKSEIGRDFRRFMRQFSIFAFRHEQFTKCGPRVRLQEALSMDFIARNTTTRVPRVLNVFSIRGTVHIIQEHFDGPILEDVWHRLSPEERRSSILQMKDSLDQLRALKPQHPGRVQAIDGSGLVDSRVDSGVWGPFDNHADFHQFLNYNVLRAQSEKYPRVQEALSKVGGKQYKTVFSHGNLGPHNVIGRIVVIDWERAGCFPEYWDYTRAHAAPGYKKDWWNRFKEVVNGYDDELELDVRISEYFEM